MGLLENDARVRRPFSPYIGPARINGFAAPAFDVSKDIGISQTAGE